MINKIIMLIGLLFILGGIFVDCTKEETPAPLPPPVKPVVEQVEMKKVSRHQRFAGDLKEKGYIAATASTPLDCGSICQKISNCLKDRASHMFSKYCPNRCSIFPDDLKNSFSGLEDCGKIAYNYHRFNCSYTCDLAYKSNNQEIHKELGRDKDICLGECMALIGVADRGMRATDCFLSKNSSKELEECLEYLVADFEPKSVEDIIK